MTTPRRQVFYLLGIGLWIAFSTDSGILRLFSFENVSHALTYLVQFCSFSLTFIAVALFTALRGEPRLQVLPLAAFIGFLVFVGTAYGAQVVQAPAALSYGAVAFLGFSMACGYCQWARLLTQFSTENAKWLLALGSLASIGIMVIVDALASYPTALALLYGILGPASYLMLFLNTRFAANSGGPSLPQNYDVPEHTTGPWPSKAEVRSLLPSIVCAMALVLISPISSAAARLWIGEVPGGTLLAPLSQLCGLVLIMIVWFVLKKDLTLMQIYGATLPLVGSIVLACVAFSPNFLEAALFVGDLGFFLVSILMVSESLQRSRQSGCSVLCVYGLFAACVYFSNVIQLVLDYEVRIGHLDGMQYVIILVLLYVFMVPAFYLVSIATLGKGRKPEGEKPEKEDVLEVDPLTHACEVLAEKNNLSPRQAELLGYLARGRDVTYIADALYLSPHTVKSYRKALYAALGVHSRQELIDLVEQTAKA